jgi:alkylation response protein AidB-like acyl-CoA dehydrogenase
LPETTATPINDGEGLIINGHKTWSTGGSHLTHMLVRVAIDDEPGVVLVRQDTPGIEWVETWGDTLSLRASDSHDVHFRDVIVPRDNLIETGDAKAMPNVWFPMMLSAVYLGTAFAARDAVISYSLERVPTGWASRSPPCPRFNGKSGRSTSLCKPPARCWWRWPGLVGG